MKLITFKDIKNLNISSSDCLNWVTYSIKNKDKFILPAKISLNPELNGDSFCNFMPSIIKNDNGDKFAGVKVVTRFPERKPALNSEIMLYDANNGNPLAIMDANWITTMRTGAVAAHSINLFAKNNFTELSILGLGNTARATLLMLSSILKGRDINIKLLKYKNQENLFIERFSEYKNFHFSLVDTYEELIKNAEVILSCVTYFKDDICQDSLFKKGVLIVPVHTRGFSNCDLFFDKIFADDYGHVCHFKNFDKFNEFNEVCNVANNKCRGRENDDERILVYNIGLSIHDMVFAVNIYNMLKESVLTSIDFEQPKEKFWV